nr:uncharacterized protein LOC107416690 [Ziziphus jujuba var. spinosa]
METDSSQSLVTGRHRIRPTVRWLIFLWASRLIIQTTPYLIRFHSAIQHLIHQIYHQLMIRLSHHPLTFSSSTVRSSDQQHHVTADIHATSCNSNGYLPLYKAAITGDWDSASKFMHRYHIRPTVAITPHLETALHVAVGSTSKSSLKFVENILAAMAPEDICTSVNQDGETALSVAATVGNTKAAEMLVRKNPRLPNVPNGKKNVPLVDAALYGQREMLIYLLMVTDDNVEPSPFTGESGVLLLTLVINSGFYDVAKYLADKYPDMGKRKYAGKGSALSILAKKPSAFRSGTVTNFWQKVLYARGKIRTVLKWIAEMLETLLMIKYTRERKLNHHQACQLVKCLCKLIVNIDDLEAPADTSWIKSMFEKPLLSAAKLGISSVVEEIIRAFPSAIWFCDNQRRNIFHLAVLDRRENVFNLLYQMTDNKKYLVQQYDKHTNTILHLVACLAPEDRLNLVSGPALQMQREIQWYKVVEKIVPPSYKDKVNEEGKTPLAVFIEDHEKLVRDGESWMRNTAQSCTVAATLVATVMFAAAITVPGGNDQEKGLPIFSERKSFIVFIISDAISMFSSVASVLMFLFILTSRYAQSDFLLILPRRLIIGFVTLFLAITSMLVAFSATLYLVLGHRKKWIVALVAAPTSLVVVLFLFFQVPLLWDMIISMRLGSTFKRQSKEILY